MTTNIVISLDTRRAKKDGTYPLMMRLGHHERTTSIPLNINLLEKEWDVEKRIVKKTYSGTSSITRLNNFIQKAKSDAMDIILKLSEAGKLDRLSVTELREKIVQNNSSTSFLTFTNQTIEELKAAQRIGTARSYKGVHDILKSFNKGKDLTFKDINYNFLVRMETAHLGNGNSYNGLAVYFRTIKAIFNKAVKAGVVENELYPFTDYKIKTQPTEKRALEGDAIKSVITQDLSSEDACFDARNYFLASYMMYGMNFTDMAFLKKENVVDGRIRYRRKKTGKVYDIKVTENLQKILTHYLDHAAGRDYIFPIIKRENIAEQFKDIQWARKAYNKKLKLLGKLCGIEQNLTSYVSRHSFATQAMLQDVPVTAISAMLGHSSLKTTQVYLKGLPSNILDTYNDKLLK